MLPFILNSLVSQIFLCHAPGQDLYSFLNFEIFDIGIKHNSLRLRLFLYVSLFLPQCRVLHREYLYKHSF